MDTISPEKRSKIMAAIRSKNTTPEITVRKLLWRMGYRYRLHLKDLPGKPDIVFVSKKKAIFVHGCFWHNHGCKKSGLPKTNVEYWEKKIKTNCLRDRKNREDLEATGWKVLTIWQCELKKKDTDKLICKLISFLDEHN